MYKDAVCRGRGHARSCAGIVYVSLNLSQGLIDLEDIDISYSVFVWHGFLHRVNSLGHVCVVGYLISACCILARV